MSNTVPTQSKLAQQPVKPAKPSRPNEQGSFSLEAHIKIFDPKTREVFMEGRA